MQSRVGTPRSRSASSRMLNADHSIAVRAGGYRGIGLPSRSGRATIFAHE